MHEGPDTSSQETPRDPPIQTEATFDAQPIVGVLDAFLEESRQARSDLHDLWFKGFSSVALDCGVQFRSKVENFVGSILQAAEHADVSRAFVADLHSILSRGLAEPLDRLNQQEVPKVALESIDQCIGILSGLSNNLNSGKMLEIFQRTAMPRPDPEEVYGE